MISWNSLGGIVIATSALSTFPPYFAHALVSSSRIRRPAGLRGKAKSAPALVQFAYTPLSNDESDSEWKISLPDVEDLKNDEGRAAFISSLSPRLLNEDGEIINFDDPKHTEELLSTRPDFMKTKLREDVEVKERLFSGQLWKSTEEEEDDFSLDENDPYVQRAREKTFDELSETTEKLLRLSPFRTGEFSNNNGKEEEEEDDKEDFRSDNVSFREEKNGIENSNIPKKESQVETPVKTSQTLDDRIKLLRKQDLLDLEEDEEWEDIDREDDENDKYDIPLSSLDTIESDVRDVKLGGISSNPKREDGSIASLLSERISYFQDRGNLKTSKQEYDNVSASTLSNPPENSDKEVDNLYKEMSSDQLSSSSADDSEWKISLPDVEDLKNDEGRAAFISSLHPSLLNEDGEIINIDDPKHTEELLSTRPDFMKTKLREDVEVKERLFSGQLWKSTEEEEDDFSLDENDPYVQRAREKTFDELSETTEKLLRLSPFRTGEFSNDNEKEEEEEDDKEDFRSDNVSFREEKNGIENDNIPKKESQVETPIKTSQTLDDRIKLLRKQDLLDLEEDEEWEDIDREDDENDKYDIPLSSLDTIESDVRDVTLDGISSNPKREDGSIASLLSERISYFQDRGNLKTSKQEYDESAKDDYDYDTTS